MKKRIGIIGYGMVASSNHKSSYRLAEDFEISAVFDIREAA